MMVSGKDEKWRTEKEMQKKGVGLTKKKMAQNDLCIHACSHLIEPPQVSK
jgi:hypothetical protein